MIRNRPFVLCALVSIAVLCSSCANNAARVEKPADWRTVQPAGLPHRTVTDASTAPPNTVARTEFFRSQPETASPSQSVSKRSPDGRRFELNMQEVEVRSVVDVILGEELKLPYTVSPQVQGKLTLRTGRPVTRESLLPILETALLSASATMIEQDGSYHIITLDSAPQRVRGARQLDDSRRTAPGYAIEVIPLRHTSATQIQKVLESFSPKGSVLQADDVHNHIIIAGSSQERSAMTRTIDSFDIDSMSGAVFAIYHVEHVMPEQLVVELRQVFQPPIEFVGTRVRLIPMERIKAILGVARNQSDLEVMEQWIRRLDVATYSAGRRLYVYNVQNGNAKDLASSLQFMLTGQPTTDTSKSVRSEPALGGSNAPPSPVATQSPSSAPVSGADNQSRVGSNDENNSLLVFCTEQEYRILREALAQLDIMPRQVMIEAILAEVTLNDNLRFGVQWFFSSSSNSVTLSTSQSGSIGSQFPGFSYVHSGMPDARIVIDALQAKTDVKVLSAPKLAVLNNQKASLQVGDQVPIRTQVSQGTTSTDSPIISSIQMQDTGVILEVTPRINESGTVILDVTQEVSEVAATTSSEIDSPTIQRRRLHTVIATRDGATVALGGLIRENATQGNSGVPWLKDVPMLGNLFRSDNVENRRTELIVLLVPHVMRNNNETDAVVDSLIGSMNAAAELASRVAPIENKQSQ